MTCVIDKQSVSQNIICTLHYAGEPETNNYNNVFLARFKNWRKYPCNGKRVRGICVFGIGDLPLLSSRMELFANKFHLDFQPESLDCIEEWHHSRMRDEMTGKAPTLNMSFYARMDYVKNHLVVLDLTDPSY